MIATTGTPRRLVTTIVIALVGASAITSLGATSAAEHETRVWACPRAKGPLSASDRAELDRRIRELGRELESDDRAR
jgi:hypothetical protein